MAEFPISIAAYSFNKMFYEKRVDVFTYLEMLKYRYHVDWADIWTWPIQELDMEYIKKIRASMDGKGMRLANLCVDGPYVWQGDRASSDEAKKKMLEYIKAAEILGAKTVRIDMGGKNGEELTEEAFDYIVKTFRESCAICHNLGMKIGPENHWGWDKSVPILKRVHAAVAHPAYGHLFHFGGFPTDYEEGTDFAIANAMHTHIPANTIPYAKEIIRRLAARGYEGTYSIEHHTGVNEATRVEWHLGAVRSIIDELRDQGLDEPAKPDFMYSIYEKVFNK